jgi:gamma-glutamylcyclotransferase (GGCT)/AIG2-like uncharacterized protein YtfP
LTDTTKSLHRKPPPRTGRIDRFQRVESIPLFTYGTLLFPEVLRALMGRVPQSSTAYISGWRVVALKNRTYPGLVASPHGIAHGRLLTGLSAGEWRLLDNFEDPKYELRQVTLLSGQDSLTYVWVDDAVACSHAWDIESFTLTHLPAYVERCIARYGSRPVGSA